MIVVVVVVVVVVVDDDDDDDVVYWVTRSLTWNVLSSTSVPKTTVSLVMIV